MFLVFTEIKKLFRKTKELNFYIKLFFKGWRCHRAKI